MGHWFNKNHTAELIAGRHARAAEPPVLGVAAKVTKSKKGRQGNKRGFRFAAFLLKRPLLLFNLCLIFLFSACASSPQETSKSLVKISNVTLSRLDERTLRVMLNYDLEAGVKLPLPYQSVLVFPLEPRGKLVAAQVPEMELSTGLIALDLEIPRDAGFDWKDLESKDACCVVSLKGAKNAPGSDVPEYERISNSVAVALPPLAG